MSDIPNLELGGNSSGVSSPVLQSPVSVEPPPSPPVSPRRASFSGGINGRSSSGRRSGSSSRSTSFSLPTEAKDDFSKKGKTIGPDDEEVEEEEEMDEEGKPQPLIRLFENIDRSNRPLLAARKHAEFVKARGRHYSNEAEAMKVCNL